MPKSFIRRSTGAGEPFGYEATEEILLQACVEGSSAEAVIDRILETVAAFSGDAPQGDAPQGDAPQGDAPQGDDMTCVVVRVEG